VTVYEEDALRQPVPLLYDVLQAVHSTPLIPRNPGTRQNAAGRCRPHAMNRPHKYLDPPAEANAYLQIHTGLAAAARGQVRPAARGRSCCGIARRQLCSSRAKLSIETTLQQFTTGRMLSARRLHLRSLPGLCAEAARTLAVLPLLSVMLHNIYP
jgi:hypothetical protein